MRERKVFTRNGMELDSREEYLFLCWYEEAESLGLVSNLVQEPFFPLLPRQAVMVSSPTKRDPDRKRERFLFHPHNYKADFMFNMTGSEAHGSSDTKLNDLCMVSKNKLVFLADDCEPLCVVDVKGGWANHQSRNSSDVTFPLNQKMVYDKYKIYVNKAVITPKKGFFSNFWAPDEAFTTERGNPSKVFEKCRRLSDIKELIEK